MPDGRIIFLHGASSAGKSTLARALQARIELPFWTISIDHLRDAGVLPSARIESGEFAWHELRPAFFDGFHRSLVAYAAAGNNLIVEHILDTPGWHGELARLLAPFDLFFVGVHAALADLKRREVARGDRQIGSAEQDFKTLHRDFSYDVEVSSSGPSVNENVAVVLAAWRQRTRSRFFEVKQAPAGI
jgi:chloramphenicol 3-O phosphotransferase